MSYAEGAASVSRGERQPVIALIGPTAVGKTALSLDIAERLNARGLPPAEFISVDSRQVYRYMDVGTDKVSAAVRREIPHHLIDIADPDEPFSASAFVEAAARAVRRVAARDRVPVFVGGTPFYYNALFHASMNASLPHDPEVRRRYEELAALEGAQALHKRLAVLDPVTAERLHPNDVRRVSRALEIWELTGTPPSRLYAEGEKLDFGLDVLYIALTRPRAELFQRIAVRLEDEFASGFPEEVSWLIEHGFDERFPPMQGLGYRELAAWRRGRIGLDEALEASVARTRAFCRRQMTWFSKFEPALWYDISVSTGPRLVEEVVDAALSHLEGGARAAGCAGWREAAVS
ncbi:MAG: tRNA (adenosine(37)-N6)-dimethylallyltransferase MiaA [Fretibacterium sp.]|nr:tRNA (adenosine(37)-N6)-dimethylallyltransferase MiaA [Fretibacterium sp.]